MAMRGAACVRLLAMTTLAGAVGLGCATSVINDTGTDGGTIPPPAGDGGGDGLGNPVDGGRGTDSGTKDTGSPSDSGNPGDSGQPADSGAPLDSGRDSAPPPVDSGPPPQDSGGGDVNMCPPPVTGMCGPGDITGFAPNWKPPTGSHQGLCTSTNISDVWTYCFSTSADPISCQTLTNANCLSCIVTNESASTWGPLVNQPNGVVAINAGGCIDLLDSANLACAKSVEADYQCENASCETNCPVTDSTSLAAFDTCTMTADGCQCATYANAATTCTAALPAGDSNCLNEPSFHAFYTFYATLFCGP